jgi:hypothetical protein
VPNIACFLVSLSLFFLFLLLLLAGSNNITWFVDVCFLNAYSGCNVNGSVAATNWCVSQGHNTAVFWDFFGNRVAASYIGDPVARCALSFYEIISICKHSLFD